MKGILCKNIMYVILISLFSCQNDLTKQNQELIIGDWYPIEDINADLTYFHMNGYCFGENGIVENKLGFIEYYCTEAYNFNYPFRDYGLMYPSYYQLDNVMRFHGNFSTYSVNCDTLNIFDPSIKNWNSKIISFLDKDTMLLSSNNDSIQEKFVRKTYELDDSRLFNQVIFYSFQVGDYFTRSKFFILDCSGTFICSERYPNWNNIFSGKMKEGEFERLELLFKKADLTRVISKVDSSYNENINHKYYKSIMSSFPPLRYFYVTFVSNNKLFTIENPFEDISFEEKEFFWAYLTGLFFPEQLQFVTKTIHKQERIFSEFNDFHELRFEKQDSLLDLYHTERFYLSILLENAELTNVEFEPLYILKEKMESKNKIETDGRYFNFKKNGVNKTLDIGFNFIKENNFDKEFRIKTQMEISDEEYIKRNMKH